jgi:phosphoglycerol transferase MdoB-like AlkP superfamily enzyme
MFVFSLCRILFFTFNVSTFSGMTTDKFLNILSGGLRFDLSAALYTNALYILAQSIPFKFRHRRTYQNILAALYFATNGIAIALNCIDMVYYRFTFRRTTSAVFAEFANDLGNGTLMLQLLKDYWWLLIVFILLITLTAKLHNMFNVGRPLIRSNAIYYTVSTLLFIVYTGLFVAGVRGGFTGTTRPITISNAAAYITKPVEAGLVLNTPFSIYRTFGRKHYPRLNLFDPQTAESLYSPVHRPAKENRKFTPRNVMIIIVESLSKEFVGSLNTDLRRTGYRGYTPFLDSLVAESFVFDHSFSNGMKSIDAMPSILASIPSLYEPYVLSQYSNNEIRGLAALLKDEGYDCSFFHGAPNGSMGFDAFARASGFAHYYGMNEYGSSADSDGHWGIWDEEFLQFTARTLSEKSQPWFASVFTLSSHHPFKVPKRYTDKFPAGTEPIHQCIGYTDMALRRFFASISKTPAYANTLFVITADHTNQLSFPKSKTEVGCFAVPIIIFDPSGNLKGRETDKVVKQTDIMPLVLGRLNYGKPFFAFGSDPFATEHDCFAVNSMNGFIHVIRNEYILRVLEGKPEALYNYDTDPLLIRNLRDNMPEITARLDSLGKAFMQTYNNRLIDNDMKVN